MGRLQRAGPGQGRAQGAGCQGSLRLAPAVRLNYSPGAGFRAAAVGAWTRTENLAESQTPCLAKRPTPRCCGAKALIPASLLGPVRRSALLSSLFEGLLKECVSTVACTSEKLRSYWLAFCLCCSKYSMGSLTYSLFHYEKT